MGRWERRGAGLRRDEPDRRALRWGIGRAPVPAPGGAVERRRLPEQCVPPNPSPRRVAPAGRRWLIAPVLRPRAGGSVAERPWTIRCFRCSRELFVEENYSSFTYNCAPCQEELWKGKQSLNVPAEVVWAEGALKERVDARHLRTAHLSGTKYLAFMPLLDPKKASAVSL